MKKITVRWSENVTHEHVFEVEDDFDPEAYDEEEYGDPLEDLVLGLDSAQWDQSFMFSTDRECWVES